MDGATISLILQMKLYDFLESYSWQVAESYSNPAPPFSVLKSGMVSVGHPKDLCGHLRMF